MASDTAEIFMNAVNEAERTRDVAPLVELFADDAELHNISRHEPARGREGAREFWQAYLDAFEDVASTFSHVVRYEGGASMEWESKGTPKDGEPLTYRGVSLVELDGDRVKRFSTFYDSAAFLAEGAKAEGGEARGARGAAGEPGDAVREGSGPMTVDEAKSAPGYGN